jgi:spore maturation protein CgeB
MWMKILLVASRHWDHLINKQDSAPFVPGQAEYFYWKALRDLGHEVNVTLFTQSTPLTKWSQRADRLSHFMRFPWRRVRNVLNDRDIYQRNQRIIESFYEYTPNVVLVSGGMGLVLPETIREIRKRESSKIVLLYADSPVVWATNQEKRATPYYDLVVTNDFYHTFQWKELGAKNVCALPLSGFDPEFHRPISLSAEESPRYQSEICFVGRLTPLSIYGERVEMLEAVADLNLSIWTEDRKFLESRPALRNKFRGIAFGDEMVKVIGAAKISLNSVGCSMQRGGNMRTFEVAGIGTFQLIDRYDPAWFEEGEEIVSFSDNVDLRKKLVYYLEHDQERRRIAKAGRKRALAQHTYKHRMQTLIDLVTSLPA